MADNYSQATLEPTELYLTEDQRAYLAGTGAGFEDTEVRRSPLEELADAANETPSVPSRRTYVFWEHSWSDYVESCDIYDHLYEAAKEIGDEPEGWEEALEAKSELLAKIDFTEMLRSILLNPENSEINYLFLQGASTCSKMRPGEFSGFSCMVTRKEYCWLSTGHLECKDGEIEFEPAGIRRFED